MNTILSEWVQRAPAVLVPNPIPRAISSEKKSFDSSSPLPRTPQATTQPKLGTRKSFRCQYDAWLFNWTGPLYASQVLTGTTSFPQKGSALPLKPQWGGPGRTRRRRYLMKMHLPAGNPLWWEHCTCAEAELWNRGRGGAPWYAEWVPGQQGVGSLTPSSAFSPLWSPFSSVPPPVEPWLQPWIESNAKFKIKSVLNLDHYEGQMNKHDKYRKMFYIIQ